MPKDAIRGPHLIEPDQMEGLWRLLGDCFQGDRPEGTQARWPHVFGTPHVRENTWVCSLGTTVASAVVICPTELAIDGVRTPIASTSFVATDARYRGRGLMSKTLGRALGAMYDRGYAFSWLIGDRRRYGAFGFETAGRHYTFTITARSLAAVSAPKVGMRAFRGDTKLLNRFMHWRPAQELGLHRPTDVARRLFSRARKLTFVATRSGKPAAYLVLEPPRPRGGRANAFEHGGESTALLGLIRRAFDRFEISELTLCSPAEHDACHAALFAAASQWRLDASYLEFPSVGHMLKILDLGRMITGFAPQIERRRKALRMTSRERVTLELEPGAQRVNLDLGEHVRVHVGGPPAKARLRLDERAMVRLLFGVSAPDATTACPAPLRSVLPLDFYVSPLEDT